MAFAYRFLVEVRGFQEQIPSHRLCAFTGMALAFQCGLAVASSQSELRVGGFLYEVGIMEIGELNDVVGRVSADLVDDSGISGFRCGRSDISEDRH